MTLKELPFDILYRLYQSLDARDWLNLLSTEKRWSVLLNYPPMWRMRAQKMGVSHSALPTMSTSEVKLLLIHRMRTIYQHTRQLCSAQTAQSVSNVLIEDDAQSLEAHLKPLARRSATTLLPLAMQYGSVNVMHSLFQRYGVSGSYQWLLMAIRNECYAAVVYLIEIHGVPLMTDDVAAILPVKYKLWNPDYRLADSVGRRYAGSFNQYNELLVREVIRTRHPKILGYLQRKILDQVDQIEHHHPSPQLLIKLKRHSLVDVRMDELSLTPDLSQLRKVNKS